MELPAGWTARRPRPTDIPQILAVVHASDIAAVGEPDFSIEEVREVLAAPNFDPDRDSWLAVDPAGEVVGWAYLDKPGRGDQEFVEVYAHPERGHPALAPLLAGQLARVAERAAQAGLDRLTVRAGAVPTEQRWIDTLRAAGFAFVKRYARMRRSLAGVSAEPPAPPAGVRIRPVRPADEEDLRTFHRVYDTAFRDTPDYPPRSYPRWRAEIAALPSVPWDEWYVAEVDGEPAGVLQSSDQSLDANEGWVRNLAVLAGHRRRGVGAALLRHAFAGYAARGRAYAGLGVDLSNPTEAVHLYRAVGMTPQYEADIFERSVQAAH
ncbi:GNAT family N-acetyltransferase [Solwaraspora sp. WMMD1047]|uniref:GNAT family N-acetyltransferase n=1 Tax=Solwaraspora sp. WMMD1047 TaxID=3016102 RepID=UPI002415B09C|nr:GNAT family N-acetyltransferase [Solwaraspora sp. WMMD1047]MDG4833339.1 GNAT family N-acetyltransferase [Solwaraspora sp. WMMD1047]